jgi:hypothetical protein
MALHERPGATDEWYTPPAIFAALRCRFDLDVASPGKTVTPWIPARAFYTCRGLERDWAGFVWMNPPFGGRGALAPWLKKFIAHGNGIALVPDRTSAPWWQEAAPAFDRILFVRRKIHFIGADGLPGTSPAQGTCLGAIGRRGCAALERANRAGLGFLAGPM